METSNSQAPHDTLEDTPLPHEVHAETVFRATGTICPSKIIRAKLGVSPAQVSNWLNWRKTPSARTHFAVIAVLLGLDGRAILESDNASASHIVIVERIASFCKTTPAHVRHLLDADRDPFLWEHRLRLHEMAIWALYRYKLDDFTRMDWTARDVWVTDEVLGGSVRTHNVVQLRTAQYVRPMNPFDNMAHYTETDFVRLAIPEPGLAPKTPARETKSQRERRVALEGALNRGVSYADVMANEEPVSVEEVADADVLSDMSLDEIDEAMPETQPEGWDISRGPDPSLPFMPREGHDVGTEYALWEEARLNE